MRNSFYDRLTIKKRVELLTKALVRDDYKEIERLIDAVPNSYEFLYPHLINTWNMHKITLYAWGQILFNFGKIESIEEIKKGILNIIKKHPNAVCCDDLNNIVNQLDLINKKSINTATKSCWEGFKRFSAKILKNDAKELMQIWASQSFQLIDKIDEINDVEVSKEEVAKSEKLFEEIWNNITKRQ